MADIAGVREEISIAGENKGKERPKNIIVRGAWVHNLKNIDVIIYEGYRQGNRKSVRGTSVVEFLFPAGYTVKRNQHKGGRFMRLLRKMQEPERFSPAEQNMINYILSHKREMAELSIRELAEKTYSSPAGIFRLCQKLGLKGYNEFKLRFISEVNRTESVPCAGIKIKRPITALDGPEGIVQKMAALEIESIEETKNEMKMEQVVRVAQMMREAKVIDIYAYDQNFQLAQMMVYNLLQVKCVAVANISLTSQLAQAMLSDASHLAIIISRTGSNKRLLRTAKILKQQGAPIVLLSSSEKTPLAKYADEFLYVANANTLDYMDMGSMIFSVGVRYYQDVLFGLLLAQDFDGIEEFSGRMDNCLGHYEDKDRLW